MIHPWMSLRCTLGVLSVGWPLLGRLATLPSFLHFVGNGSHRNSLDVNYFVSRLLLYIVLARKTELGKERVNKVNS